MSANSFTGEPGSMPYDRDAYDDRPTNAVCPNCEERFWKGRDDTGDLCDRCSDVAWMEEKDRRARRVQALADTLAAEVLALQALSFNQDKE